MSLDTLRTELLSLPAVTAETPFGADALVFKVMGRMFALSTWQETPLRITLKCNPVGALALHDQYAAVSPGYHMNKQHWNTVILDGSIEFPALKQMINDSYNVVVHSLPKYRREELMGFDSN